MSRPLSESIIRFSYALFSLKLTKGVVYLAEVRERITYFFRFHFMMYLLHVSLDFSESNNTVY